MPRTLATIDDTFLHTAGLVLTASINLPHSPEQVWAALTGDNMGSWMSIIDRAAWLSQRPLNSGARRTVRIARFLVLDESYYRWEAPHRATFRVTGINLPVVSGWAEDFRTERQADGSTRLTWTMAIDNKLVRVLRIPRRLRPAVEAACRKMMQGITTIMPSPQPSPVGR